MNMRPVFIHKYIFHFNIITLMEVEFGFCLNFTIRITYKIEGDRYVIARTNRRKVLKIINHHLFICKYQIQPGRVLIILVSGILLYMLIKKVVIYAVYKYRRIMMYIL